MTADLHAPPAAAPLADARRNVQAARSALQAAVTLTPALLERVAPLHAALADVERELEQVRP